MKKSWMTTTFGLLAGIPVLLHQLGITVGHLGNGDWLTGVSAVGVTLLGLTAKDSNISNSPTPVEAKKVDQ